ncbi:hypothetical protein GCM10022251_27470 [Phytohabitans flavus]|uniref:Bulb-type lectin domain-containing protein n=3 Tax=Phytohabitans flavus TaxID=1076124 RepID=A0A6F8XP85_9ACTN|nr:hypothetical protein Pflav_020540 [Phytohabitans flavus]
MVAMVALLFGAQQPALAANGPEGVPITLGAYFPDIYRNGVHTPLSGPYQWLDRGNWWTFGNVDLVMQNDGNLVMYRRGNHSIVYWASNTQWSGASQLLFQRDGNLVLYTPGYARAVWASNTYNGCSGETRPFISIQSDSNLVIYCARQVPVLGSLQVPIWATNTSGV